MVPASLGTPRSLRRPRRRVLSVALSAVVAAVLLMTLVGLAAGEDPASSAPAAGPDHPPRLGAARVVDLDDVGDPFILPVRAGTRVDPAARYVLFWTTDWESNVPTAVSADLAHWRRIADALPVLPSWAAPQRTMTWAPSALQVTGGWVLYFSTQERVSGKQCIGAAFAADPAGPYRDPSATPLVCQRSLGGSIDPGVVRDDAGRLSLLWKNDGNAGRSPVSLWQQPLAADGRSVTGRAHRLLVADQRWQHGIVEGPAMLAATTGGWWLFYSAGLWQSNTYDTGVAWCATVAGPCRATAAGPLLASTPTAVSPGGLDTFTDSAGKLWATYSAFPNAPADARAAMAMNRVLRIAPVLSH